LIQILLFFLAVTLQAQQPLRTKPVEKLIVSLGFRDWGAITIAGNTVLAGHPNDGGGIYAIDGTTGKQKWFHVAPKSEGNPSVSRPAVVSGDTVLVCYGKYLVALSLATGRERWRGPAPFDTSVPIIAGNMVYMTDAEGALNALDLATGKILWKTPFGENRNYCGGQPALRDGVLYSTAYFEPKGRHAIAVDAKTGAEKWRTFLKAEYARTGVCLVRLIATSEGVFATGDQFLLSFDLATGTPRWEAKKQLRRDERGFPKGFALWSLTDAGSMLTALSDIGLHLIDKTTGAFAWTLPGKFTDRPMAVSGDILYFIGQPDGVAVVSKSGMLHALDLQARQIVWSFARAEDKYNWSFHHMAPFDNGLWVDHYGVLLKLQ